MLDGGETCSLYNCRPKHFSYSEEFIEIFWKCAFVFKFSAPYSCQILMKLEFSRQIFEKYSNV